jgi:hypothetical protein
MTCSLTIPKGASGRGGVGNNYTKVKMKIPKSPSSDIMSPTSSTSDLASGSLYSFSGSPGPSVSPVQVAAAVDPRYRPRATSLGQVMMGKLKLGKKKERPPAVPTLPGNVIDLRSRSPILFTPPPIARSASAAEENFLATMHSQYSQSIASSSAPPSPHHTHGGSHSGISVSQTYTDDDDSASIAESTWSFHHRPRDRHSVQLYQDPRTADLIAEHEHGETVNLAHLWERVASAQGFEPRAGPSRHRRSSRRESGSSNHNVHTRLRTVRSTETINERSSSVRTGGTFGIIDTSSSSNISISSVYIEPDDEDELDGEWPETPSLGRPSPYLSSQGSSSFGTSVSQVVAGYMLPDSNYEHQAAFHADRRTIASSIFSIEENDEASSDEDEAGLPNAAFADTANIQRRISRGMRYPSSDLEPSLSRVQGSIQPATPSPDEEEDEDDKVRRQRLASLPTSPTSPPTSRPRPILSRLAMGPNGTPVRQPPEIDPIPEPHPEREEPSPPAGGAMTYLPLPGLRGPHGRPLEAPGTLQGDRRVPAVWL